MANVPRNAVLILGLGQFGRRVIAHLRTRLDAVDARRALFYGGTRPDLFDEVTPYHGMRRFLDNCLELRGQVPRVNDLTALAALNLDARTGALELGTPQAGEVKNGIELSEAPNPANRISFESETLLPPLVEKGGEPLSRRQLFAHVLQNPARLGQRLLEKLTPLFSQENFPQGEVTCAIYIVGALTELSVSALAWPVTAALRYHLLQKLGPSFEPHMRLVGLFSLASFAQPAPPMEAAALAALQEFEHFSHPASRANAQTVEFLGGAGSLFLEACGRRLWQPCYLLDRAKLEPPLQVKDEYELVCSTGDFLEASVITSLAAVIDNRCHNYRADMERLAPYSTLGTTTHCLPIQELARRGESFQTKDILRTRILLLADAKQQESLRSTARQAAQKVTASELSVEALLKELIVRSGRLFSAGNTPALPEAPKSSDGESSRLVPRLSPRLDRPRPALGFQANFFWPVPPHDWYQRGLSWYHEELQNWFRPPEAARAPGKEALTREERLSAALGTEAEADLLQRWSQACAAPSSSAPAASVVEAWMRRVLDLTLQQLNGETGLPQGLFFLEALAADLERERYRLLERGGAPHKRDFDLKKHQWLAQFMKLAQTRPDTRRLLIRLLLVVGTASLPAVDYALRVPSVVAFSSREWWGMGLLAATVGLSLVATLITLGGYLWRSRRLQTEFLQIYRVDLAFTIEDRVYEMLQPVYALAHGLVTHLHQYLRQTYDALYQYTRAAYVSQLPEDAFTFRSRFHPELNRRIVTSLEPAASGQPRPLSLPLATDLRQMLQYQGALYLVACRTPSEAAARLARESLVGASVPEALTAPKALAELMRGLAANPANTSWRALPGSAQLTLEDFLADPNFADGAPLGLAEQVDQFWKQALPNLDVNRNLMRDQLKDGHPDWELRQQNFAEVVPLQHEALVLGLPNEASPVFAKSARQVGATLLGSLDPFSLTCVRTLHGLTLSANSFSRYQTLKQAFARLGADVRQQLCLPVPAGYPADS